MLIFSFLELHIGLDLQKLRLKKKSTATFGSSFTVQMSSLLPKPIHTKSIMLNTTCTKSS